MSVDQALLKENWKLFDKNGTGMITKDEVGLVLRSVGFTPTHKEADELAESVSDAEGNVSWDSFQRILLTYQQESEPQARAMLLEAFRVYDKDDNGLVALNDLRSIFTTLGEPLSYDEVDQLLQLVPVDAQGKVKSEDFINMLFSRK